MVHVAMRQGIQRESVAFQKIADLQKSIALLQKECAELRDDGRRRQESYLRREAQMRATIEELENRQRAIQNDVEPDDDSTIQLISLFCCLSLFIAKQEMPTAIRGRDSCPARKAKKTHRAFRDR